MQKLFDLHNPDGPERCGVILTDDTIVELENMHPSPFEGFAMDSTLLEASDVVATWHTHPTTSPNLSVADFKAFRTHPRLMHYVVAETEIWCYGMSGDILLAYDNYHLTRPPQGIVPPGNPGTR